MRTALRVKFPDHQGKYREFPGFQPSWCRLGAEKATYSLRFFIEFPTQLNREFFKLKRELFRRNREFALNNRETPPQLIQPARPRKLRSALRRAACTWSARLLSAPQRRSPISPRARRSNSELKIIMSTPRAGAEAGIGGSTLSRRTFSTISKSCAASAR